MPTRHPRETGAESSEIDGSLKMERDFKLTEGELAEVGMFLAHHRELFIQFMIGAERWEGNEKGFSDWAQNRTEDADAIIEKFAAV